MKVFSQTEVMLSKDNEKSYVRYSDHMKEVHELRREVERLREAGKDALKELDSLWDSKCDVDGLAYKNDKIEALRAALNSQKIFDSSQEVQGENGKYHELLYAVGTKYSGESRHETALRYIRQAERRTDTATNQKED
jgi:hypothetical protein